MADQRFRDLIAGVTGQPSSDEDGAAVPEHRLRAPGMEPGRPKRGQPGWKDPDVKRRGVDPPSARGVRSERF